MESIGDRSIQSDRKSQVVIPLLPQGKGLEPGVAVLSLCDDLSL
jgi:hypothetical protein